MARKRGPGIAVRGSSSARNRQTCRMRLNRFIRVLSDSWPRRATYARNDVPRDHRIGGGQMERQKPIEHAECLRFGSVVAAGRAFELKEALQRTRDRRGEIRDGREAG